MTGSRRTLTTLCAALAALVGLGAAAAWADLALCNKTSYVLEAALGLEDKGAVATRGWFRVDPGQCRTVLQGALQAEKTYVHARALAIYGASPLPQAGHADLCVADGNFVIAGATTCAARAGHRPARFTEIKPAEVEQGGLAANLAEEADYAADQARLAGIQRLLVIAGYDANPIDGIEGRKTEAAIAQFVKDRKLPAEAANAGAFFDTLMDAVKTADGVGFSWCNETAYAVMAAVGLEDQGQVVTRGWYRVEPGKCVKPEIAGRPARVFSFAEAIGGDGRALKRGDRPIAWGGPTILCTRDVKFELADQTDCAARGLTASGFATVDLAGRAGATVRFRAP